MYIGIIAPTLERKHSPTKQRFELYHHVNTLTDTRTPTHTLSLSLTHTHTLMQIKRERELKGLLYYSFQVNCAVTWYTDSFVIFYNIKPLSLQNTLALQLHK